MKGAKVIPTTVRVGATAIAAGHCGRTLSVCYEGFDANVICGVWRRLLGSDGLDTALNIEGRADVQRLRTEPAEFQLAIVHTPKMLDAVNWALQLAPAKPGARRPAVFSLAVPENLENTPGNTLILHANAVERDRLAHWLSLPSAVSLENLSASPLGTELGMQLQQQVTVLMSAAPMQQVSWQARQVAADLVAGVCVLQSQGHSGTILQAYDHVRAILQSPVVCPTERPSDRLAAAMISRANLYLSIKYGEDRSHANPFVGGYDDIPVRGRRPNQELITRREVADLGNPNSVILRQLIEYLQQSAQGDELFANVGLLRPCPNWNTLSPTVLGGFLVTWTPKQVRTVLGRLRQDGFLTAERPVANGPWLYSLPDSMTVAGNRFRGLPPAAELETALG